MFAWTDKNSSQSSLPTMLRIQEIEQIATHPCSYWKYRRYCWQTIATSDKNKSNAPLFPVFLHMKIPTQHLHTFHSDKSDDILLSNIAINPFIIFKKVASLKTGKITWTRWMASWGVQTVCRSVMCPSVYHIHFHCNKRSHNEIIQASYQFMYKI